VNELSQGTNGAALTSYDPILDVLALLWAKNVTNVNTAIMAPRARWRRSLSSRKPPPTRRWTRPRVLADWRWLQTGNASITETQGGSSAASTLFLGA
jgi:hypothetical protein